MLSKLGVIPRHPAAKLLDRVVAPSLLCHLTESYLHHVMVVYVNDVCPILVDVAGSPTIGVTGIGVIANRCDRGVAANLAGHLLGHGQMLLKVRQAARHQ